MAARIEMHTLCYCGDFPVHNKPSLWMEVENWGEISNGAGELLMFV
jgi:hypothetical protein